MKRAFTAIITPLLTVLLASGCAAPRAERAAPLERDAWYAITDGGQHFGFVHVAIARLEDGTFEYAVDSQVKVELLGTRQQLSASTTLIVDEQLAPLRMESQAETMSGRSLTKGRRTEHGFVLEVEQDGRTHSSTFAHGDPERFVVDLTLPDRLHRLRLAPGEERRFQVLAVESGKMSDVGARLLERGPAGSTWAVEADDGLGPSTIRLDADGLLTLQIVRLPPMRIERSTRERATRIEHRRIPDRELLVFTPEEALPALRRLERVRLRLSWSDIPPEEFVLQDARQRVESLATEGAEHVALVVLERPDEIAWDFELPFQGEGFDSALGETEFIKPFDARIAAAAREIVGEERSALAAARALCRWVYEHVKGAMIAETLSGPEVLERRTGKCTEYTTLFASLARAAGIPTRVALGQRRFDGSWGGHMWNEVYLGEWIPVDASADEVGGSLALLKLVHSDTVMGTQPLRWKLTESFAMSIAGYELTPEVLAAESGLETGLAEGEYVNVEHGFRLRLPSEEWRIDESGAPGGLLRLRPPDDSLGDSMMIHLVPFEVGAGMQPGPIVDARLGTHRSRLVELELLLDEPFELDGAAGRRIRFQGRPRKEGGVPVRVTEAVWIRAETGCLLNLIATEDLHERYLPTFETLLASFRYLDE